MKRIGTLAVLLLISVSCGSEKAEEKVGTTYATVKFDLEEQVIEEVKFLESLKKLNESRKFVDAVETLEGFLKGIHSDVEAVFSALHYLEKRSDVVSKERLTRIRKLIELLVSYRQPVVG